MSELEDDKPDAQTQEPGHPRVRASAELGEQFAALLAEEHSHQLGVCGQLGIPYSTYKTWMADDPEANAGMAAFRRIVLAAVDKQRRDDLKAAQEAVDEAPGTHAATVWNMRKFRHESRFKRFYADEPAKLELTGKDGGPVELDMRNRSVDELIALAIATGKREDDGDE
jgi:hypothetical protein